MIPTILILLSPAVTTSLLDTEHENRTGTATSYQPSEDPEYTKRKNEAGKDPAKLWKVYEWCNTKKLEKEGKTILREILKVDPDHKDANVALGNVFHDGKWFANQKKVDEYTKEQETKAKKAQGLVEWKGRWVRADDVPFLEKGLEKDDSGNWVNAEEAKKLKDGWTRQDLEWIAPADKEKVEQGLYKCGDQFLSLADANKFHAELLQWWRIPLERYVIHTTCDREVAEKKITPHIEKALDDLERIYGMKAAEKPVVLVLRNAQQYGEYSGGSEEKELPSSDSDGLSSVHYAFPTYYYMDGEGLKLAPLSICYWDDSTVENAKWGVHAVRAAIGYAFVETIDASPKAYEKMIKSKKATTQASQLAYWDEKKVPMWLRWGAATFAERYYKDTADIKPNWPRDWSIENIRRRGGLRSVKQILECDVTSAGGSDSEKLINETGFILSFILEGNCVPVTETFKILQDTIKAGKDKKAIAASAKAVEDALAKHEAELKKYGNF